MSLFVPSPDNQTSEYIHTTPIEGLIFIKHKSFSDDRGFYAELSRIPEIETELDIPFVIKQVNLSHSKQNVARGFHAEDWNKLLTVTNGIVFAVWLDLRTESPSFGKTVSMKIGKDNGTPWGSMFVSSGIANSFCTLTTTADYLYAVDQLYADRDTTHDVAISMFDPDLNVDWPIPKAEMIVSERDLAAVTMKEKFPEQY
jgi:dTDP-4-dehydrorhamnose 3,5-epimerase